MSKFWFILPLSFPQFNCPVKKYMKTRLPQVKPEFDYAFFSQLRKLRIYCNDLCIHFFTP